MTERKEEMGMTDMQYKDHLRGLIADLERIRDAGVSEEARAEIERLIARFRAIGQKVCPI